MSKPIEQPVTVVRNDNLADTETTHPAFAQIVASRINGATNLYDSEFHHRGFIAIRIKRSQLNRSLHRDWHFAREEIVEVHLSEAQWATFISSMNMGDGVPCTLDSLGGKDVPGLPDPKLESEKHSTEVREKLEGTLKLLEELRAKINASGLSQKKAAELLSTVSKCHMTLGCNLDFACESFDKHVEKTVEKAKQEVHGYITGNIMRAGLEALGSPIEMPALESPK